MADYFTSTVVRAADIPLADMTPLERLVLGAIFEIDEKPTTRDLLFRPRRRQRLPFAADRRLARRLGSGGRHAVPAS